MLVPAHDMPPTADGLVPTSSSTRSLPQPHDDRAAVEGGLGKRVLHDGGRATPPVQRHALRGRASSLAACGMDT
jgi:hypothetical protein